MFTSVICRPCILCRHALHDWWSPVCANKTPKSVLSAFTIEAPTPPNVQCCLGLQHTHLTKLGVYFALARPPPTSQQHWIVGGAGLVMHYLLCCRMGVFSHIPESRRSARDVMRGFISRLWVLGSSVLCSCGVWWRGGGVWSYTHTRSHLARWTCTHRHMPHACVHGAPICLVLQ